MTTLAGQIVQPGGSTTSRLDELLRRPAAEVLAAGERPPAVGSHELAIVGVRALGDDEAAALCMRLHGEDVRSAVALSDKIRVRHHTIARMMAAGAKKSEISRLLGCAPSTLMILERSPAFQALLLEYMNMLDQTAIDNYTRLQIVGSLGIDELTDRLATRSQSLKTTEVLEIVKVASDRTGLGPSSTKQVTLNGRLSPADIRAAKTARPIVEAVYSEEDPAGGAAFEAASVRDGEGIDLVAEGRAAVREELEEVVGEEDNVVDLVLTMDAVLGRDG